MTVCGLFGVPELVKSNIPGTVDSTVMKEFAESEIALKNLSDEEIHARIPPPEKAEKTSWIFYGAYKCGGGFSPTMCTDYKIFDVIEAPTFAEALRRFTENNKCRLMYLDDPIKVRKVSSNRFEFNLEDFYEVEESEP